MRIGRQEPQPMLRVKQIRIGGSRVGLIGLDEVFNNVKKRDIKDDEALKDTLLSEIKVRNYVYPSVEEEYRKALFREYKKFLGEKVEDEEEIEELQIQILGPGCPRCQKLEQETMEALIELNISAELEHITDVKEISEYGVFGTPAFVINRKVKSVGKVPNRIIFNRTDITNLSITERARLGITFAWQIPANFEGITVREYLSIKNGGIAPEKCLSLVGLSPALYLDRTIDANLSGGERKRIELASVFSIKPKLVILDEPDSGIDMASMDAIKKAIKTFKRMETAVMLITHSEEMAGFADRVSLLCDGKIAKEGDVKINFTEQ